MKTFFLLICSFLFFITASTQPAIVWEQNYGGSLYDGATEIIQTSDGKLVVLGASESSDRDVKENNGLTDYWIIKIDTDGAIIWEKTIGNEQENLPNALVATKDGGFVILGISYPTNGYVITKLDNKGNFVWEKKYGVEHSTVKGNDITETKEGDLVVVGSAINSDYLVTKLDATGDLIWEKTFGGSSVDNAAAVTTTMDGGLAIVGYSRSTDGDVSNNNGGDDYWVIKVDKDGDLIWERNFGSNDLDRARIITETVDGGLVIGGYSIYIDDLLLKLDKDGNVVWERLLDNYLFGNVFSIIETYNGDLVLTGAALDSRYGIRDSYATNQLNTQGHYIGGRIYGGFQHDASFSVVQTSDGQFVVAGGTSSNDGEIGENYGESDFWIVKLGDCFAPTNQNLSLDTLQAGIYRAVVLIETIGAVIIDQEVFFEAGQSILLKPGFEVERGATFHAKIKTCKENVPLNLQSTPSYPSQSIQTTRTPTALTLNVFPNPTSKSIEIDFYLPIQNNQIKLDLTNSKGQQLYNWSQHSDWQKGKNSAVYDISQLNAGIYIVQLSTPFEVTFKKLVVH